MNKFTKIILILISCLLAAEIFMSYYWGIKIGLSLQEISPFQLIKGLTHKPLQGLYVPHQKILVP